MPLARLNVLRTFGVPGVSFVKSTSPLTKVLTFGGKALSRALFMPIQAPFGFGIKVGQFVFPTTIAEANLVDVELKFDSFGSILRGPDVEISFLKFTLFELGRVSGGFEAQLGPTLNVGELGLGGILKRAGNSLSGGAVEAPTTPKMKSGVLIRGNRAVPVEETGLFFHRDNVNAFANVVAYN